MMARVKGAERGQSTLEFILLIPLMLLLWFGVLQVCGTGIRELRMHFFTWMYDHSALSTSSSMVCGDNPAPSCREE